MMKYPSWPSRWHRRLVALLRKRELERDMDEEMRFHLEMEAEELVRTRGLPPAEARRRARVAFGGMERYKEEARDVCRARWIEDLAGDLCYAARSLRGAPGFTAAVALTLALGIGATTALFSVVESVLLQPLPFGDPAHTVVLWSSWKDFPKTWVSYDEYELYREEGRTFDAIALFADYSTSLTGNGEPERVRAANVSRDLFRVLGVAPALGRGFRPEEEVQGNDQVAILGHSLWQRRYAGDPSIVGRRVELEGKPFVVVGVMPAGFRLPLDYNADGPTQLLTPLVIDLDDYGAIAGPAASGAGGSHAFYAAAHLAPGVTPEQANRALRAIADRLTAEGVYPRSWHFRARAVSLREQISGQLRPALFVLLGAVGLVLLIACANVAGLLFVRGERRRRETTLRAVLGAARPRLARQFLAEGLVLALVGGGLGVMLARLGVEATRAWAPASLPLVREVSLNARVLGFALVTTLLTLVLFALAPALSATRVQLTETLKDGGRGATTGRVRLRARELLVVAEVALAVVLLVGGGLLIRTVQRMLSIDPGFRSERVLTMELSVPSARYPEDARVAAFYDELRRRVSRLPGVQAVGAARLLPLAAEIGDRGLFVEGYTPPPGEGTPGDWQVVTPGYFEAMGFKLLRGRLLDDRDDAGGALSIIVNRRFAEKYLAGRDPVGARVRISNPKGPPTTVVGVVDNVQHNALTADVKPMFFAPHAQFPITLGFAPRTMSLAVKTSGDPLTLVRAVREEVRALDPQIPVSQVRTMKEIVRGSVAQQRFSMLLLGAFAGLALLLAIVGIYGVVAQVVTARTPEFGVRAALGATPGNLVQLSLWGGLRQTAVGLALGTGAALALTRLMTGLLYSVAPTDPLTFALALAVTGLAATAASWIPARRAGRVNPANALVAS